MNKQTPFLINKPESLARILLKSFNKLQASFLGLQM